MSRAMLSSSAQSHANKKNGSGRDLFTWFWQTTLVRRDLSARSRRPHRRL
jgi:hypothetical protein